MAFDFRAGYAVFTVFQFVVITPILGYWLRSLRRVAPIRSAPLRIAHLFVRVAPPIYALGALLGAIFGAIMTAAVSGVEDIDDAAYAAVFINFVTGILIYAADIAITLALYMSTIAALYAILGKATWWKTLRLDAPIGGGILLILAVAFFGRNIHLATGTTPVTQADRRSLLYLPLIVDLALLAITVGQFCTIIYVTSKLKKRGEPLAAAMGKIPTFLLVSSILWAIRCSYATACDIKEILPEWTSEERGAQLILYPILELGIGTAVLALLTSVVRKPVWADPALNPGKHRPEPAMGQYPGGYSQQPFYPDVQPQPGHPNPAAPQPGYPNAAARPYVYQS